MRLSGVRGINDSITDRYRTRKTDRIDVVSDRCTIVFFGSALVGGVLLLACAGAGSKAPCGSEQLYYADECQSCPPETTLKEEENSYLSRGCSTHTTIKQFCILADGTKHGPEVKWTGEFSQVAEEGSWEHGEKHGLWTEWSTLGVVRVYTRYGDDNKHSQTYYKDGQLNAECYYDNFPSRDFMTGSGDKFCTTHYDNGQMASQTRRCGGEKHGLSLYWTRAGEIRRAECHHQVQGMQWTEEGDPGDRSCRARCDGWPAE